MNKKKIFGIIVLIIFICTILIYTGKCIKVNKELNKFGYTQYNNKIILPKELQEMEELLEETMPATEGYIFKSYTFPVNYELRGANLEKNYRNEKLATEDKWYIMLQDAENLTSILNTEYRELGDNQFSHDDDNTFKGILFENVSGIKYNIGFGEYEHPYLLDVNITHLATEESMAISFEDGSYEIRRHNEQNYSNEEISKYADKFIILTNELYEKYLIQIDK